MRACRWRDVNARTHRTLPETRKPCKALPAHDRCNVDDPCKRCTSINPQNCVYPSNRSNPTCRYNAHLSVPDVPNVPVIRIETAGTTPEGGVAGTSAVAHVWIDLHSFPLDSVQQHSAHQRPVESRGPAGWLEVLSLQERRRDLHGRRKIVQAGATRLNRLCLFGDFLPLSGRYEWKIDRKSGP